MSGIVSSFKTEYERKLHPTQNAECTYIIVPTSLVFCVVVFIQSRLNLPQMVGPKAPPSVCSLAIFSRAQSTIPSSSIIFLCIGSSCGDPGHCISSLWEPGISCIIPKSCKPPPFLSCSFMLKWARLFHGSVSYCLCFQESFTPHRVQQPPPALRHVPTDCANVFLTFSHGFLNST